MKEEWHRRKKGLTEELKQSARQTKRPSNKKNKKNPWASRKEINCNWRWLKHVHFTLASIFFHWLLYVFETVQSHCISHFVICFNYKRLKSGTRICRCCCFFLLFIIIFHSERVQKMLSHCAMLVNGLLIQVRALCVWGEKLWV